MAALPDHFAEWDALIDKYSAKNSRNDIVSVFVEREMDEYAKTKAQVENMKKCVEWMKEKMANLQRGRGNSENLQRQSAKLENLQREIAKLGHCRLSRYQLEMRSSVELVRLKADALFHAARGDERKRDTEQLDSLMEKLKLSVAALIEAKKHEECARRMEEEYKRESSELEMVSVLLRLLRKVIGIASHLQERVLLPRSQQAWMKLKGKGDVLLCCNAFFRDYAQRLTASVQQSGHLHTRKHAVRSGLDILYEHKPRLVQELCVRLRKMDTNRDYLPISCCEDEKKKDQQEKPQRPRTKRKHLSGGLFCDDYGGWDGFRQAMTRRCDGRQQKMKEIWDWTNNHYGECVKVIVQSVRQRRRGKVFAKAIVDDAPLGMEVLLSIARIEEEQKEVWDDSMKCMHHGGYARHWMPAMKLKMGEVCEGKVTGELWMGDRGSLCVVLDQISKNKQKGIDVYWACTMFGCTRSSWNGQ